MDDLGNRYFVHRNFLDHDSLKILLLFMFVTKLYCVYLSKVMLKKT